MIDETCKFLFVHCSNQLMNILVFFLLNSFMMYETDVFIGMIEYFFSCFILSSQKLFLSICYIDWIIIDWFIWKIRFLLCWYNEQIESLIDFFFFSSVISIESRSFFFCSCLVLLKKISRVYDNNLWSLTAALLFSIDKN